MQDNTIYIYTDGACSGNPGKGGFGVVMMFNKHVKEFSKGFRLTTNNRMELLAVIEALKAIKKRDIPVIVTSDSKYVVDNINKGYLKKWELIRFKNIKNPDLWKELIALIESLNIRFQWVKGHHENIFNNRCDELAVMAYQNNNLDIDAVFEKSKKS